MLSPTILQEQSEYYGPDKEYYFVNIGSMIPIRVEEDNYGTWFVMDGDWSNTRMLIGYQVEMKVELPTFYPLQVQSTQAGTCHELTLEQTYVFTEQRLTSETLVSMRLPCSVEVERTSQRHMSLHLLTTTLLTR